MRLSVILCCLTLLLTSVHPGVQAATPTDLTLSARSAIVMDALTGEVLYEKNADEKRPMASTTKIMTTLLALESADCQQTVITTKEMVTVEGSGMGLLPGDQITMEGLCYGMMLSSGNDAANTVATVLAGSLPGFAERMNQKAAKLGMRNTHFVTSSGLDAEGHYSTAYDMAVLMQAALKNQQFCQITQTYTTKIAYGNPPYKRTLTNHNRLLKEYDGCIGGKTGFTKKSGRCLVSAATRNGATLICVTLSAPDDWNDHKQLLDYGFSCMEPISFADRDLTLAVVGGTDTHVSLHHEAIHLTVPKSIVEKLSVQEQITPFLYAPIEANEIMGIYGVFHDGRLLHSVPIFSIESIPQSPSQPSFWHTWWRSLCGWLLP